MNKPRKSSLKCIRVEENKNNVELDQKWKFVSVYIKTYISKVHEEPVNNLTINIDVDKSIPLNESDINIMYDFFMSGKSLDCRNEEEAKQNLTDIDLLVGTVKYDALNYIIVFRCAEHYAYRLKLTAKINNNENFLSAYFSLYKDSIPEEISEHFPSVFKYIINEDGDIIYDLIFDQEYTPRTDDLRYTTLRIKASNFQKIKKLSTCLYNLLYSEFEPNQLPFFYDLYFIPKMGQIDNNTQIFKLFYYFKDNRNSSDYVSLIDLYKQEDKFMWNTITSAIKKNTISDLLYYSSYSKVYSSGRLLFDEDFLNVLRYRFNNSYSLISSQMNFIWDPEDVKILKMIIEMLPGGLKAHGHDILFDIKLKERIKVKIPTNQYKKLVLSFINLAVEPLTDGSLTEEETIKYKKNFFQNMYYVVCDESEHVPESQHIILKIIKCIGDDFYREFKNEVINFSGRKDLVP